MLPYRHIWSSSVAERAALLGRPVIATNVGGLADQVGAMPGAVLVDDNTGLAAAMAAGASAAATVAAAARRLAGGRRASTDAPVQDAVDTRAAVVRGGRPRPGRARRASADGSRRRPPRCDGSARSPHRRPCRPGQA